MLNLKLNLCRSSVNKDTDKVTPKYGDQVNCIIQSSEADAYDNGHPNSDWLEMLAEQKLGESHLQLLQIQDIDQHLAYLREEIRRERISTSEIVELQDLAEFIQEDDVELRQWAGISEIN